MGSSVRNRHSFSYKKQASALWHNSTLMSKFASIVRTSAHSILSSPFSLRQGILGHAQIFRCLVSIAPGKAMPIPTRGSPVFAQPVETQVKSRSMFLLVFPDPAKSLDRDNSPSLSFPIHFVCVANRDPARNLILMLATSSWN